MITPGKGDLTTISIYPSIQWFYALHSAGATARDQQELGFAILWTWCPPRIVVMHRALGCLENQRGSRRFRASRRNTNTQHSRIALVLSTDDLLGQYQPIVTALLGTQAPSQSS